MSKEAPFIHSLAICEAESVGSGTRIWPFSHALPGSVIGEDCNICESVFIEGGASVGDRVTIKNGVQLWDGVHLESDVFVGPNVSFTNDYTPRSRDWKDPLETRIAAGASLGAGAVILPGITIGEKAMVGAGAVVTRSVPPYAKVVGNPARIRGYVDLQSEVSTKTIDGSHVLQSPPELPGGCSLVYGATAQDMRGSLAAYEIERVLPFSTRRFFTVYDVPSHDVRGEHAHRECWQALTPLRGQLKVMIDDGEARADIALTAPEQCLVIPPGVWAAQYEFRQGAILGVFASHPYDSEEYLRDYDEYLAWRRDLHSNI